MEFNQLQDRMDNLLAAKAQAEEDRYYANNSKQWADANKRVHALERAISGLCKPDRSYDLRERQEAQRVVR